MLCCCAGNLSFVVIPGESRDDERSLLGTHTLDCLRLRGSSVAFFRFARRFFPVAENGLVD